MNILKDFDFSAKNIFRVLGMGILGIIFVTIAIWLIGFAFRTAFSGGGNTYYDEYATPQSSKGISSVSDSLSIRNLVPEMDMGGSVGIYNEEDFEVTEYSSSIKTRNLDETCSKIEDLKSLDYVVFENSNKNDRNCSYFFKVKNEKSDEVLGVIKDLKPETLQTNKYTLKNVIDDYTNEIDILSKKLESVERTLTEAQTAYDQITVLATKNQDVESLAKIIDSKIQLIERLTKERMDTKEAIDRLNRSKGEQIDRVDFTFFSVSIYDVIIFDYKQIKDSWVSELRQFVDEFNSVIQNVTVGLATYLLRLIQIIIYLFIALLVIKYGWRLIKIIWRK
ncbi:hypothetical protein KKG48_02980 [Patescibacteria group bacterium]|nr:hypothetical protein [Patescibacteria group bacterium]